MITLEYLAGFLDGEGSVYITCYKRKDKKYKIEYWHFGPMICIGNTNKKVLELIQKDYGGGISVSSRKGRKTCYHLRWCGMKAKKLAVKLLPHVIVKKKHMELFIKYPFGKSGYNLRYKPDSRKKRARIYLGLKRLNIDKDSGWDLERERLLELFDVALGLREK